MATAAPPNLPASGPAAALPAATDPLLSTLDTTTQSMDFDELSGRTIHPNGPWTKIIQARKNNKSKPKAASPTLVATTSAAPNAASPTTPAATTVAPVGSASAAGILPALRQPRVRKPVTPSLPDSEYVIVYRPRAAGTVARCSTKDIVTALVAASKLPPEQFYASITLQIQPAQNLLVASTANEDHALLLSTVDQLALTTGILELSPYLKPPPGTVRGVIHGLDEGISNEDLNDLLAANGPSLLHARLLGRTSSALLTFQGPHVPFYVKVGCLLTRCRPYRRAVQFCRICGDVGHRQDICPRPDEPKCIACGTPSPSSDHNCQPSCKLCSLPHITASKDCPKRFLPRTTTKPKTSADLVAQKFNILPAKPSHHVTQVSWSQVAAPFPTAQHADFPPLPTPVNTPLSPPSSPSELTLSQAQAQFQRQLNLLMERVDKLEHQTQERLIQIETQNALLIEKINTLPVFQSPEETTVLIDRKITEAQTTTTNLILRIEDALTTRTKAIEQQITAMNSALVNLTKQVSDLSSREHTPYPKKQKTYPQRDVEMAATLDALQHE